VQNSRRSDPLTYKQLAPLAGASERTLMRWVAAGKFPPPYKQNPVAGRTGLLLFDRALVDEWLRTFRGAR
jgi:predicted DNA-binding transcriptional regulator AlpA